MNNDGWNTTGVGTSDMRLQGKDLQHNRQTADENPSGITRMVRQTAQGGGPMKEALTAEEARHRAARAMRLSHLEKHLGR